MDELSYFTDTKCYAWEGSYDIYDEPISKYCANLRCRKAYKNRDAMGNFIEAKGKSKYSKGKKRSRNNPNSSRDIRRNVGAKKI